MSGNGVTRRSLLRGAAAAPTVLLPAVLAGRRRPPPSERIALGHIGVGNQGSWLLRAFLQLPDARSVAVCDPFRSRRERWAAFVDEHYARGGGTGKGCAASRDFRELLAREDIDAVVVATPDHWHVPIALAAVAAGKDVYLEKPLGVSVAEGQALRRAVRAFGAVLQYGTMQRSSRNFRFACELVRNGRLGRLHTVHAWCFGSGAGGSTVPVPVPEELDYDLWLGPAPLAPYTADRTTKFGAYFIADYALGYIAGWGAHPLDIAQWGLGADHTGPIEYEGEGAFPRAGLFDTATDWDVRCRYASGVEMRFMSEGVARKALAPYGRFEGYGTLFLGTAGWVNVDRSALYADPPELLRTAIGPEEIHLPERASHYQDFLDCIRLRAEPLSPIEAAVRSDTISQLADIAIRTGRKIRWDPERETILGDDAAARLLSRPRRSPWTL